MDLGTPGQRKFRMLLVHTLRCFPKVYANVCINIHTHTQVAHGITKSWTRLSDFTFNFHFQALEKEMATHSSVLAWRIPGTGELLYNLLMH